jgi:glutamate 5-kinase
MNQRVVIKIGSSSLTGANAQGLSPSAVDQLVDAVATLKKSGAEVVIVSSGAIAAGLSPLGLTARPKDLATQQAAASVGQGLLIHRYTESLARYSIVASQVLLTIDDVVRRSHYQNVQRTLTKLLQLGVVPIINENDSVGTQEIRFGDNDRIAALVLITDVDGLYDAPPSQPSAKVIPEVDDLNSISGLEIGGAGSKVGSGGMVTKIEAARIATGAGIPMLLTSLEKVKAAVSGEKVGTLFKARTDKKPSRLLWLAHASTPLGALHVDAGAAKALVERGVSLLPAGVTKVAGEFSAGDTVEIVAPDGKVIARGLVGFDSEEIPMMLGRSTKDLGRELGPDFERELVHRDDLVLL